MEVVSERGSQSDSVWTLNCVETLIWSKLLQADAGNGGGEGRGRFVIVLLSLLTVLWKCVSRAQRHTLLGDSHASHGFKENPSEQVGTTLTQDRQHSPPTSRAIRGLQTILEHK